MAINITNSQGVAIYILDLPTTEWANCTEARTAIEGGKQVLCPQSLGALEETRNITEYRCLSSNESMKVAGAISRGSIEIGMLFDPNDTAGQDELIGKFESNEALRVGIIYPVAEGSANTKGAMRYFNGFVSTQSETINMDEAVLIAATIDISSEITRCPEEA